MNATTIERPARRESHNIVVKRVSVKIETTKATMLLFVLLSLLASNILRRLAALVRVRLLRRIEETPVFFISCHVHNIRTLSSKKKKTNKQTQNKLQLLKQQRYRSQTAEEQRWRHGRARIAERACELRQLRREQAVDVVSRNAAHTAPERRVMYIEQDAKDWKPNNDAIPQQIFAQFSDRHERLHGRVHVARIAEIDETGRNRLDRCESKENNGLRQHWRDKSRCTRTPLTRSRSGKSSMNTVFSFGAVGSGPAVPIKRNV